MYMLEKAKKTIILSLAASIIATSSYAAELKKNIDGAVIYPKKDGKQGVYHYNKQDISGFQYGKKPTANEIKAWDIDVMPDGTGLPDGQGTVEAGDELYHEKCASCHGDFGAGGKGYPTLSGGAGTLKNQLLKAGDEPPLKTIGSYWPYVSTLFWYIKTAMPFTNPKSLTNDEVYSITAYLLSVNEITTKNDEDLDDEFVLNKKTIMDIKMPNANGFYPVDPSRSDLKELRTPLAQGNRCMKDCETYEPISIAREITGFEPKLTIVRDLPEEKKSAKVSIGEKIYNESCSSCHGNPVIGAPVLGNKEAWAKVKEKGIEKVYLNAINGINAMPPRGGTALSDKQMKETIDYMIDSSK